MMGGFEKSGHALKRRARGGDAQGPWGVVGRLGFFNGQSGRPARHVGRPHFGRMRRGAAPRQVLGPAHQEVHEVVAQLVKARLVVQRGALAFARQRVAHHLGHAGDGNIHVIAILSRDIYLSPEACETSAAKVNLIVHEESVALKGSISAEHGIGKMHIDRLARFKPELDLSMMKSIKKSFDPKNIMNPNKIFRA